jgi:hypothetical protein
MIRLNPRQRVALSETFRELANLVAAALVVGQFVAEQPPFGRVILIGVAAWLALVSAGLVLEGERQW